MPISTIKASNFRNFSAISVDFNSNLNLFYGHNGSGKTSILEMLYFLSYGKSFRTNQSKRLASFDSQKFTLFTRLEDELSKTHTIGVEKSIKNDFLLKLSGEKCKLADVSVLLPIQLLNNDSFALLNEGPVIRRQFLDWGVFHVKHSFLPIWREYQKILKQRNIALKSQLAKKQIQVWDIGLVKAAEQLTALRREYLEQYLPIFCKFVAECLDLPELSIEFNQGWPIDRSLAELINENLMRELSLGYTFYGAHRADLKIRLAGAPIEDVLSRGQQKLFVWVMKLIQALVLSELTNKKPIILIDDLTAEWDEVSSKAFIRLLTSIDAQYFVTAIAEKDLELFFSAFSDYKMFHVKHNSILMSSK